MKAHNVILTVDIATSGTKVAAYTEAGEKVSEGKSDYDLFTPEIGYAVQSPDDIRTAFERALHQAVRSLPQGCQVRCISLGAVMHSVLGVNDAGNPITPVITWADTRSKPEAAAARTEFGISLYQRIGVPIHAMLPLCKIAWLRRVDPVAFAACHRFVSIKEYILFHLTQTWAVDISTAAASGLYNIVSRRWDDAALQFAGIDVTRLSELRPCMDSLPLTPDARARLGLRGDVKVVIGSTDGILANLGSGAVLEGDVAITLGSSGAVRRFVGKPEVDEAGRTFCYPLADDWFVVGGSSNSGGVVWRWILEQLPPVENGQVTAHEPMVWDAVDKTPPGADDLLFLPYLSGERAPIWDDGARGAFVGLTLHHRREHMWRAAVEGMAYALDSIFRIVATLGPTPSRVIASGGFFRQPIWTQLVATVLGIPVTQSFDDEASSRGSFLLAMAALEQEPLEAVTRRFSVHFGGTTEPDWKQTMSYRTRALEFQALYTALRPILAKSQKNE